MLKTNSKQAAANIRAYIVDGFTPEGYTDNPPQDFPEIAAKYAKTTTARRFTFLDPLQRMWYNRYVKGVPECYLSCC